jgi:GH24 family phage-related lysozyme (muramidase)
MAGDRRLEMRQVRLAVGQGDMRAVACAIRRMKRLWVGKGLDGLLHRRDDEAALVESAMG